MVADPASFEAFYRDRLARVVRACLLVTLDAAAAEDIAAESFARLWAKWDTIQDEDHAGGYVFTTAMRLCAKRRRRTRREVVEQPPERSGRSEADEAIVRREVFGAMRALPLRQRQAVVLRDWAGFETGDVAHLIGIRESTVRVHLARGRAALRKALIVEERER